MIEVKTAEYGSFDQQVRRALAQLLEYEFRYRDAFRSKPIRPIAVIEAVDIPSQLNFAKGLLAESNITLLPWRTPYSTPDSFELVTAGISSNTTSAIASRSSTYTVPTP